MDLARHRDRSHWHRRVGQPLGQRDEVGRNPEAFGGGGGTEPAKAGDDLVEDQQDAVPGADLAQLFQIADRRDEHPGRSGKGFDDHRSDCLRPVERDDPLKLVGEMRTPGRLASAERHVGQAVGMRQMIDPAQ